jgi:hypothetical protein
MLVLTGAWGSLSIYTAFHPSDAFVSDSPTGQKNRIDCVKEGFSNISYYFRAHDLQASLLEPIDIGDLFLEGRYFPGHLYWSRDGTVAAASVISSRGDQEALSYAYDFREHRALRPSAQGSPLPVSTAQEIQALLNSRGGYSQSDLPSFKDL